jgi:hypothetical protein
VSDWHCASTVSDLDAISEQTIVWCRQILGRCRRPYGIDHFELALARSIAPDRAPRSATFRDLRPHELYVPNGLQLRIAAFLHGETAEASIPGPDMIGVAVAIFSWGDAADVALPSAS